MSARFPSVTPSVYLGSNPSDAFFAGMFESVLFQSIPREGIGNEQDFIWLQRDDMGFPADGAGEGR
jgi:hypothetical protein